MVRGADPKQRSRVGHKVLCTLSHVLLLLLCCSLCCLLNVLCRGVADDADGEDESTTSGDVDAMAEIASRIAAHGPDFDSKQFYRKVGAGVVLCDAACVVFLRESVCIFENECHTHKHTRTHAHTHAHTLLD